ncbi:hypothetical protein [Parendozoicomonas haliclonae]|uniref:NHL repeat protein n=1 Tax=Parendozoicomonas haliclonae TaxID=1960125 RepID=A0A1X7APP4_9GAMM|nr:hypothetical protein [Parendozoicomonas haliclonae]SMA50070.1 NHL repeat protein [Parendozoicomonas haliclonae]
MSRSSSRSADIHLSPLATFLILSWFGLLLVSWVSLNQRAITVDAPGMLKVDKDNRLWVDMGRELLVFSSPDTLDVAIERNSLDSDYGDFLPLDQGRLILSRQGKEYSFWEELRTFLRLSPEGTDEEHARWLQVCRWQVSHCDELVGGDQPVAAPRTFRLLEGQGEGDFYLVDTGRHRIVHYGTNGIAINSVGQDLLFPNGLAWINGQLILADTNNHRVVRLASEQGRFGQVLEEHLVKPAVAREAGDIWPIQVVKSSDSWFVLQKSNGMDQGGIYRYSHDWQFIERLATPSDSDVLAITLWDDVLLAADYAQRVMTFDAQGQRMVDMVNPAMDQRLQANLETRDFWELMALLVAGLALFSFFFSCFVAMRKTAAMPDMQTVAVPQNADTPILWIEANTGKLLAFVVFVGVMLIAVFAMMMPSIIRENNFSMMSCLVAVAGMMILMIRTVYFGGKKRIGICGETIVIEDHHGRQVAGQGEMVLFNERQLIIGEMVVPLGSPEYRLFPGESLQANLWPLLGKARRPSNGEVMMIQLRNSGWFDRLLTLVITVSFLLMLLLD